MGLATTSSVLASDSSKISCDAAGGRLAHEANAVRTMSSTARIFIELEAYSICRREIQGTLVHLGRHRLPGQCLLLLQGLLVLYLVARGEFEHLSAAGPVAAHLRQVQGFSSVLLRVVQTLDAQARPQAPVAVNREARVP